MTAVIAQDNSLLGQPGTLGLEVGQEPLGRLEDHQVVHPAKPRPHPASDARRPELQALQHDLAQGLPVGGVDEVVDLRGGDLVLVPSPPGLHQAHQGRVLLLCHLCVLGSGELLRQSADNSLQTSELSSSVVRVSRSVREGGRTSTSSNRFNKITRSCN